MALTAIEMSTMKASSPSPAPEGADSGTPTAHPLVDKHASAHGKAQSHGAPNKKKYEFRFGGATWFVELIIAVTLSTTVVGLGYRYLSHSDFEKYFQPMLGYMFLASAIQGAFFKFKHVPTPVGYVRYLLSLPIGACIYFLHSWMIRDVLGVSSTIMTPIHLTWIIPTFLLVGIDHPIFGGHLLGWINPRGAVFASALKFLFIYFLSWLLWVVFVLSPLYVDAGDKPNMSRVFLYLALWLSCVVGKLFLQFLCKEWLDEVFTYDVVVPASSEKPTLVDTAVGVNAIVDVESHKVIKRELNYLKRGWSTMAMVVAYSIISTFFMVMTVSYMYHDQVSEPLLLKAAFNALASPLIFIFTAGPYSDCFKSWHGRCSSCSCQCNHGKWTRGQMSWGHLAFVRLLLTLFFAVVSYLFFNLVIGSLHIVGEPWVYGLNLMWNMASTCTLIIIFISSCILELVIYLVHR